MTITRIGQFKGEYDFLSNFYFHPAIAGVLHGYITTENFYQAMKTTDKAQREQFKTCAPGQSKRLGRRITLRDDWDDLRDEVMLYALRRKFSIPDLTDKLKATGDAFLVEGNVWHDNYWGNCTCNRCADIPGDNMLGKLLMQVREEI